MENLINSIELEVKKLVKEIQDLAEEKTLDELEKLFNGMNREQNQVAGGKYSIFDFSYKGISASFYQWENESPELEKEIWFFKGDIEEPVFIGDLSGAKDSEGLPIFNEACVDLQGIQF